jgi:hypothetical protein
MLDAPVSGGVAGAEAATLTIFVGGERAPFERLRQLLERLGRTILHMGGHGAGQVTKLAKQIAQLANLQGAAEALFFAAAQGVDAARVREALLTGFGASRMLDLLGRKMVARDFAAGIVAALHHKDLGVALALAHEAGLPLPVTAQVAQQLNALMGNGWGGLDTSALLRVLEQAAGRAPVNRRAVRAFWYSDRRRPAPHPSCPTTRSTPHAPIAVLASRRRRVVRRAGARRLPAAGREAGARPARRRRRALGHRLPPGRLPGGRAGGAAAARRHPEHAQDPLRRRRRDAPVARDRRPRALPLVDPERHQCRDRRHAR